MLIGNQIPRRNLTACDSQDVVVDQKPSVALLFGSLFLAAWFKGIYHHRNSITFAHQVSWSERRNGRRWMWLLAYCRWTVASSRFTWWFDSGACYWRWPASFACCVSFCSPVARVCESNVYRHYWKAWISSESPIWLKMSMCSSSSKVAAPNSKSSGSCRTTSNCTLYPQLHLTRSPMWSSCKPPTIHLVTEVLPFQKVSAVNFKLSFFRV